MPSNLLEPHAFSPTELLALLNNLKTEIATTEQHLNDENDKRNMFKVDGCRRTHNYDDFICTFLSMLAHEGALGELLLPRKMASQSGQQQQRQSSSTSKGKAAGKRRRKNKCRKRK